MSEFKKIIFLGTGSAMAEKAFNTCIAFLDENNDCFLIDAGGGNSIFYHLKKANIEITQLNNIFITHNHTDHILGILWIMRKFASIKNDFICDFYLPESVYNDLMQLSNITISKGQLNKALEHIKFNIIHDSETFNIGKNKVTFFNTLYEKTTQFGCKIESNNLKIGFCGDVPLLQENFSKLKEVDILIHEALCDSINAEKYKVYKKGHSTAKDAGKIAKEIKAKKLILIHKDDEYINNSSLYKDAISEFDGDVIIPEDGDIFNLEI